MPTSRDGRVARPSATPTFISCPTPAWSIVANGFSGRMRFCRYSCRNPVSASSREMPNVVCVRSLVPNEKNSASRAISPAVTAARGTSIIVPNW